MARSTDATIVHPRRSSIASAALCVAALAMMVGCSAYDRARYAALVDSASTDVSIDASDANRDGAFDGQVDASDASTDVDPDAIVDAATCNGAQCGPGQSCCDGSCVDLERDGANCGTCGNVCAHTVCTAGSCTNVCLFGFQDCNGNLADGCEAAIATDLANCGRCGNACSSDHATSSCQGGTCHVDSCSTGFEDCDGAAANGCEVETATDVDHCGSCANACPVAANSIASCAAGACSSSCDTGFGDCNGSSADGCESSLANATHCGSCAVSCGLLTPTCSASGGTYMCTNGCATGLTRCGTSCVSLINDPNNCGACALRCMAPTGGTVACVSRACVPSCPTGTTLCGSACVATATDLANCGSCGNACAAPMGGMATCTSGTCGIQCNPGCVPAGGSCNCVIAPPRPIAPLSTTRVTTQQPTLRWALSPGNDGGEVTLCRNRALTDSCQTNAVSGTSFTVATVLAAGTWYWRLRGVSGTTVGSQSSPVWQFVVPARSTMRDGSWGSAFDANGDGFGDVVIGAPQAGGGAGALRVYYGSVSAGAATGASLTGIGTGIGSAVASAGDFDGDGFADALAGAPTGTTAGWVMSFRGGESGLATTYSANLSGVPGMGSALAAANDVDHDGYADFVIGSPSDRMGVGTVWLQYGDPSGTFTARTRVSIAGIDTGGAFGSSIAAGGDLNCDGHPDLVVGAPDAASGAGHVFVFYGDGMGFSTAMPRQLTGTLAGGHFGATVAIIGDVNADGCMDIAVGRRPMTGSTGGANVFIFHGSPTGVASPPTLTIPEPSSGPGFGSSIAAAGDINNDGYADMFVGAPTAGIAYVYVGGATGITSTTARFTVMFGPASGTLFGTSIAPTTNINGDEYDDLVAGAPGASASIGAIGISTSHGTSMNTTLVVTPPMSAAGGFGQAIACFDPIGDVVARWTVAVATGRWNAASRPSS